MAVSHATAVRLRGGGCESNHDERFTHREYGSITTVDTATRACAGFSRMLPPPPLLPRALITARVVGSQRRNGVRNILIESTGLVQGTRPVWGTRCEGERELHCGRG